MLTHEEKRRLIAIARESISNALAGRPYAPPDPGDGALAERRGAFVTLRTAVGHELRGCVGYPQAVIPLARVVADAARKAALEDYRFSPVQARELAGLAIEVSVLSPFTLVRDTSEIQIGRDGLLLEAGSRRGLLLPQVAPEYGMDVPEFLDAVCRKSGLPPGAWAKPGAELFRFSAEIVEEADVTT